MMSRNSRAEHGAVAVVFAICATLLFGIAALGVDLGNAMNRKKLTQNNADLAALAGAASLPALDATSQATVRQQVATWLNSNGVASDGTNSCAGSDAPVAASDLGDGNDANGEVTFPSNDQVRVVSPPVKVSFGMAAAIGFSSACVQSVATAAIKSGSTGMAPYYVTGGCTSNLQTMKSNSGGLSIPPTVPVLKYDAQSNSSVLTGTVDPPQIPKTNVGDPPNQYVTITGSNLDAANVDAVGFFNSDQTEPAVSAVFSNQTAGSISVQVPNAVQSHEDVWWIRVHHVTDPPPQDLTTGWSARNQALPLQVGEAILSCNPESSSGNFGSVDFPWSNSTNDNIETSIKDGLPPPMSLMPWPADTALPAPSVNAGCHGMGDPSVWSSPDGTSPGLKTDTNCLQTTTGLDSGPASDGYLGTDNSDASAKLRVDTSSVCQDKAHQPVRDSGVVTGKNLNVNADLLSCFLADDSLHLSDTLNVPTGATPMFIQDIWKSPRFILVPVLQMDPTGTKWAPIVRMVPGFITNQPTGASRINNFQNADSDGKYDNGLIVTWSGSHPKLGAIQVFLFDIDALPPPPDGSPLIDYIGGPKVPTLTN